MSLQPKLQQIRDILLREWDPLGVGDNPNLADEYDGYLAGIVRLIDSQIGSAALDEHLAGIERDLGLQRSKEQRVSAVRALLEAGGKSG